MKYFLQALNDFIKKINYISKISSYQTLLLNILKVNHITFKLLFSKLLKTHFFTMVFFLFLKIVLLLKTVELD